MKKLRTLPNLSNCSPAFIEANPHIFGGTNIPQKPTALTEAAKPPKPKQGRKMNGTELKYAAILEIRKRMGEIADYAYEGIRISWGTDPKTGKKMYYKPDFFVTLKAEINGEVYFRFKCVEVKGPHIYTKDAIRFKGCRSQWPQFEFEMWQLDGEWKQLA